MTGHWSFAAVCVGLLAVAAAAVQGLGMVGRGEDPTHNAVSLLFLFLWGPDFVMSLFLAARAEGRELRILTGSRLLGAALDAAWLAFGSVPLSLIPILRLAGPLGSGFLLGKRLFLPQRQGRGLETLTERLLGRYRFELDRPARLAAPEADASGAALVESGPLRVDAARAVRMMGRWQLSDADEFVLCWARVAALQGASSLSFEVDGRSVTARFDGRALEPELVADPLAALTGTASAPSAADLTAGLLGALRLGPSEVLLASGQGEARRTMRVASGAQTLLEGDDALHTVLSVRWKASDRARARALRRLLRSRLVPVAREVTLDGERLGLEEGAVRSSVSDDWVVVSVLEPPGEGRIRLCVGEVVADVLHERLPAPVCVTLGPGGLSLDASRARVVRDQGFKEALQLARLAAEGPGAAAAASHPRRRRGSGALTAAAAGGALALSLTGTLGLAAALLGLFGFAVFQVLRHPEILDDKGPRGV